MAPIDIDNNGSQDLVLRNTDPAIGNHYDPVILLENTAATESIEVPLRALGLPSAQKSWLVFSSMEQTVTREVRSVNGAVQAEPTAFFGVPDGSRLVGLSVHWPDGSREDLGMPEAGKLVVQADR